MNIAGRPVGIAVAAVVIALNGIASLAGAVELARVPGFGGPAVVLSVLIGLLLLHRAYAVWSLKRGAWAITVLLLSLRTVLVLLPLLFAAPTTADWVYLALAVLSVLYLLQPGVRALFAAGRQAQA